MNESDKEKKCPVYTGTGDKGETSLVSGTRVAKDSPRVELYGTIDELNSQVGMVTALLSGKEKYKYIYSFLKEIQTNLFTFASSMACEASKRGQYHLPNIEEEFITSLEQKMDGINNEIGDLQNFILPGGGMVAAAQAHVCRSITRRLERMMVGYEKNNPKEIPDNASIFINRLSDYFFMLARFINFLEHRRENVWRPSK